MWQTQYADAVETEAEAREALAARPRFGRAYKEDPGPVARTYLLAGMADEALPLAIPEATRARAAPT